MNDPETENGQGQEAASSEAVEQATGDNEAAAEQFGADAAPVETGAAGAGDAGQEAEAEASASDEAAIGEQLADKVPANPDKYVQWLESLVNAHRVHEGQIRAMARRAGVATPDFEHPSFDEFCKEPS